jgi:hypothetical protein
MISYDLQQHVLYRALSKYHEKAKAYPKPDERKGAEEVVAIAKAIVYVARASSLVHACVCACPLNPPCD